MPAKVLVIDDDMDIVMALTVRLCSLAYQVSHATNGADGLKAAREQKPDVIILDIRMPGMDGFEVNRRLKADSVLADVPVIFLSAHAQEAVRQAALAAGSGYFLTKPYSVAKLCAAMEAVTTGAAGNGPGREATDETTPPVRSAAEVGE